jgi:basic membrane protein A
MVKRVDNAVYDTIAAAENGSFEGGVQEFGLEDGGISLAPFGRFDGDVPQEVKDAVDQARQDIISGDVKVPEAPQ